MRAVMSGSVKGKLARTRNERKKAGLAPMQQRPATQAMAKHAAIN